MGRIGAARPSPAMAVAVLALAAGFAGSAIAAPDATTSAISKAKVKRIAKKQADKQITRRAPGLSVANADQLGGVPAAEYLQRSELAPVPETNLTLNSGWTPVGAGLGPGPARAYRDQIGVVHLAGLITRPSGSENVALTLPPDLRPGYNLQVAAVCDQEGDMLDPRPGVVLIDADGDVRPRSASAMYSCTERLSLDGISFRAGG